MPAPRTTPEFVELLRRSRLLEPDHLIDYLNQLETVAPPLSPGRLARRMIRDGLLTHLQAGLLLQGRHRQFVIAGKYKLLEHLGTGGMATVYLCEHVRLARQVAIKMLPVEKAEDPVHVQRFYREARAVAALNHPNLVRAHDVDHDGSLHFLVMEYIDGSSLMDVVKQSGPMPVSRAVDYIFQAACGLEHAHANGLIHRDIKPSNILVDRTGLVKLLDLGLARFFHDQQDMLTNQLNGKGLLGTADFLSPEQARDSHEADGRSDIYSLGATFYFLLTGHGPYPDGTVAQKLLFHQTKVPTPVSELRPDVPDELCELLARMLAKNLDDRPQTPSDLIHELEPLAAEPVPPPSDDEMPRLCPAARRYESTVTRAPRPIRYVSDRARLSGSSPVVELPPIARRSMIRILTTLAVMVSAGVAFGALLGWLLMG